MAQTPEQQIAEAYQRMASEARYRPKAPGDSFGNIYMPIEELDLADEIRAYSAQWHEEENKHQFWIGACNFPTRPATIFAVEAARNLCSVENAVALRLLRMAVAELEQLGAEDEVPPWRSP